MILRFFPLFLLYRFVLSSTVASGRTGASNTTSIESTLRSMFARFPSSSPPKFILDSLNVTIPTFSSECRSALAAPVIQKASFCALDRPRPVPVSERDHITQNLAEYCRVDRACGYQEIIPHLDRVRDACGASAVTPEVANAIQRGVQPITGTYVIFMAIRLLVRAPAIWRSLCRHDHGYGISSNATSSSLCLLRAPLPTYDGMISVRAEVALGCDACGARFMETWQRFDRALQAFPHLDVTVEASGIQDLAEKWLSECSGKQLMSSVIAEDTKADADTLGIADTATMLHLRSSSTIGRSDVYGCTWMCLVTVYFMFQISMSY